MTAKQLLLASRTVLRPRISRATRGVLAALLLSVAAPATASAAPTNDDYANRLPIALGTSDMRSNTTATIETNERLTTNDPANVGCAADGTAQSSGTRLEGTLWWQFTGNGGPITVSSDGTPFDSVLAIYDTTTMALVGCNDDIGNASTPDKRTSSELLLPSIAGRAYAVQFGGCAGAFPICAPPTSGNAVLRVSATPPNDSRAAATTVPASGILTATNTGATTEPGEITACSASPYAKTIWFRYTATATGTATFSVSGADTDIAIYKGTSTTPLACNDDAIQGESGGSRIPQSQPAGAPLKITPGDYYIQVGGYYDPGLAPVAARHGPLNLQATFTEETDVDGDGSKTPADCNDTDPQIHPGAPEIPNNNIDENCDGVIAQDQDGDGHLAPPAGDDCRDDRPDIYPGATDIPGNGIDENCDGSDTTETDRDHDGVLDVPYGPDCDANNQAIRPGAIDIPGNGVDENCDGVDAIDRDRDIDGVLDMPYGPDCNPANAAIRPGARDIPENGIDEDCSGSDATFPDLRASIGGKYTPGVHHATILRLSVFGAPIGSIIQLRCTRERVKCTTPRSTRKVSVKIYNAETSIAKTLQIRAGTRLEVRVSKAKFSSISRVYIFERTNGRVVATYTDYCLRRGHRGPCTTPVSQ